MAYRLVLATPILAMNWGNMGPVRLQKEEVAEDVFGATGRIDHILERMSGNARGVFVYLRDGSVGVARSSQRTRADLPAETEEHDSALQREADWREIGLGAQILKDLGVQSIRLLASRERHYIGFSGFGIEIAATDILDG